MIIYLQRLDIQKGVVIGPHENPCEEARKRKAGSCMIVSEYLFYLFYNYSAEQTGCVYQYEKNHNII